ncbi:uncharacterized protein UHOD_05132 [Ustilago sp. UG-2017b]|nr:uncharacterized protein UHOD_05132 [Ustilago sp. UG-2017b]
MPVVMRPSTRNKDEVLDAERLRQIARRKEQNRNAQRRLRERKEEYTMQLEAQLADLHRRSQSQEEESRFLREALARMRAENQTLAEQISMIHQVVPSTQTSHPLPQRASIDLGIDLFAHTSALNRNRNRSQSVTASTLPHFAFSSAAAPWSATSSHHPVSAMHPPHFVGGIAPGATHRLLMTSASPLQGAYTFPGGLPLRQHESMEDVAMARSNNGSRRSSLSPHSQRRDSIFDTQGTISRHGSGQTDLTLPSADYSDSESVHSTKIQGVSAAPSVHTTASMAPSPSSSLSSAAIPSGPMAQTAVIQQQNNVGAKAALPNMPPTSDDVMASCLKSIHSLPMESCLESIHSSPMAGGADANKNATQKINFDGGACWMSLSNDVHGQLALPDFRQDLSNMPKPLGMTPGALGLSNMMPGNGQGGDGWSISPWINMAQTPSAAGGSTDMEHSSSQMKTETQRMDSAMAFDGRTSLASRRGFSGSLKLESRAN